MISTKVLTNFLGKACQDGVSEALLVDSAGSVLGVGKAQGIVSKSSPEITASFLTNIWDNFSGAAQPGKSEVRPLLEVFLTLENGSVALGKVGTSYIVVLCCDREVNQGALRDKLAVLMEELTGVLSV